MSPITQTHPKNLLAQLQQQTYSQCETQLTMDKALKLTQRLFEKLTLKYGTAFTSQFTGMEHMEQAKAEWAQAFVEDQISPQRMKTALDALKNRVTANNKPNPFPPNQVEFLGLCQLKAPWESLNLPDPKQAYIQICKSPNPWAKHLNPVLYHAASQTGIFEMKNLAMKEVLDLFTRNYEIVIKRVLAGEEIANPIPKGIPKNISKPLSRIDNKNKLAELRASTQL